MPADLTVPAVGEILDRAAARFADNEAVVFGDERVDYRELKRRADGFARGLLRLGLRTGDHVVIWMPNCIEWNIAFFGVAKIGAVIVSCNTRYKAAEVAYLLHQSDAKALITTERFDRAKVTFIDILREIVPEIDRPGISHAVESAHFPLLRHVIMLGKSMPAAGVDFRDVESSGSPGRCEDLSRIEIPADAPVQMIYTSGSTGDPKGCLLSHRGFHIKAMQRTAMFPWQADDRFLVSMPYFHIAGTLGPIIGSCLKGSCQVVMDVFDPAEAMRLIATERITILSGVPTMFQSLLGHPDFPRYDLGSLRYATVGSAPVSEELMRRISDRERGLGVEAIVIYGLTETGGTTHATRPKDPLDKCAGTVGRPLPEIEDRIVDPGTGREVESGREGEIQVKGPGFMLGYYSMPDATAARFQDGWLRTGDVGIKDDQGYLRVVARLSEAIIVGGFKVYPADIERILLQHPKIADAAVVGVPDPLMGEVVMAFVIPKASGALTPDEVIASLRGRIANFKVPRCVRIVDRFPTTASGKIQKFALRD